MPEPVLSLKSFIQRARVRALYREALRLARQSQDRSTQHELTSWARHEFDQHRHVQDQDRIETLMTLGRQELRRWRSTMMLSSASETP
ncbi:MAG: hypothetical protein DHS80DRAFT_31000 [Piptocephalis tieghemiana]|nr:MAG: hypothetical protein DHS80DRAFT_31000 [Piptocephalis tieghemiana]